MTEIATRRPIVGSGGSYSVDGSNVRFEGLVDELELPIGYSKANSGVYFVSAKFFPLPNQELPKGDRISQDLVGFRIVEDQTLGDSSYHLFGNIRASNGEEKRLVRVTLGDTCERARRGVGFDNFSGYWERIEVFDSKDNLDYALGCLSNGKWIDRSKRERLFESLQNSPPQRVYCANSISGGINFRLGRTKKQLIKEETVEDALQLISQGLRKDMRAK